MIDARGGRGGGQRERSHNDFPTAMGLNALGLARR